MRKIIIVILLLLSTATLQAQNDGPYQFIGVGTDYMGKDLVGLSGFYAYKGGYALTGISISPGYYKSINHSTQMFSLAYNSDFIFLVYGGSFYLQNDKGKLSDGITQNLGICLIPFCDLGVACKWNISQVTENAYFYIHIGIPIIWDDGHDGFKSFFGNN